jgi:hypothetical protein
LEILFSPILCTCPNQHNLFNLTVSVTVVFFKQMHRFLYWLIPSDFLFYCHILALKFFYTLSFQKCSICFLSLYTHYLPKLLLTSRSWFRASSFIKLNKNQLDAPLF